MSRLTLRLPETLHHRLEQQAEREGVSQSVHRLRPKPANCFRLYGQSAYRYLAQAQTYGNCFMDMMVKIKFEPH
jgi:hypothetical protein